MKNWIMLLLLTIVVSISCACCEQRRESNEIIKTNNGYQVELLFDVNGCKVYRYYDKDAWRYFEDCNHYINNDFTPRINVLDTIKLVDTAVTTIDVDTSSIFK